MDILKQLFGITFRPIPATMTSRRVFVRAVEQWPDRRLGAEGRFLQVTAQILNGGNEKTLSFNTHSKDFARKLNSLIASLPFECMLTDSKFGNGRSYYLFE